MCEGQSDAVDLEGDIGAVGRIYRAADADGGGGDGAGAERDGGGANIRVDLKGTIYRARMMPSAALMVVRVEANEAKVETLLNSYMELQPVAQTEASGP